MKKYDGYDNVQAFTGEYERLEPGGYICRILKVEAVENDGTKNYDSLLRIGFDIAEGDHKDYFRRQFDRKKQSNPDAKWPGMYYQTVKADDLGFFKGFITTIEKSNPGFKWDWDERKLVGKLFGGLFAEEEYKANDGSIKTSVKCRFVRSIDTIREGKYTIPPKKTLEGNRNTSVSADAPLDDDDLPF